MGARQAAPVIAALVESMSSKVLCQVVQQGVSLSAYSNGTATSGSGRTLVHSGGGATKYVGQYFSLVSGGVRYLHIVTAVAGSTLTILPSLKVTIAGNEALEFGAPKIEGWLDGNEQSWTIGLVSNLGLSFRVNEAQ